MNLVEITVRTKDEATSSLKNFEKTAKDSGSAAGKNFSGSFDRSMGGGLLGGLFGKSGSSATMDAQKQGQNVGLGLGRGILQKFNQTLGSGLLSGLFGTSGGGKLFGNAGNTVVQDATKQGESIAQGLGKGLNDGFGSTQNKISGVLSGLFSKGSSTQSDAESQGEDIGRSFTRGLSDGFSRAGSSVSNILSGLFGGSGSGPDENAGEQAGKDAGNGFWRGLTSSLGNHKGGLSSAISGLFTGGGGGKGSGSGVTAAAAGALNSGGIAGGALPGVAGVSGMAATVTGLAGALVSVLPAITSVLGGLTALGGGFAILMSTDKKFAAAMQSDWSGIKSVLAAAALPLVKPFEAAAAQIVGFFKSIGPSLKEVFGDSAQLIEPLVKGFEGLMTGAGPGFLAMIKDAGPAFKTLSAAFSGLGKDLGALFTDFAAAEGPSAVVLKALLGLIGSLLPLLGKLGEIFASAVAPAVAAFAAAISRVLPALSPLLDIIAQLAGAVLTDLAGMLSSIGTLLVDLAPSFTVLAKAAGGVFTALENDGVFATLSNALESLAGPIANIVNALVKGLAPAIPAVVKAFSSIATVLTAGLVTILTGVANALAAIIKAVPPAIMTQLAEAFVAVYTAVKLWGAAQAVLNVLLTANPIGVIIIALAAVAAGFYLAWEKSAAFRDIVKNVGTAFLDIAVIILEANRDIINSFLTLVSDIINGAARAFGWVPGLGGLLKTAATNFTSFKNSAVSDLNTAISTVQGLTNKLHGIPSNTRANVSVTASGSGGITFTEKVAGSISSGGFSLLSLAGGGRLPGFGGGDRNPALLEDGETVVSKEDSRKPFMLQAFKAAGVPGYSGGGVAGLAPWTSSAEVGFARDAEASMLRAEYAHLKAAVAAAAQAKASAAASSSAGSPGPGGGAPAANAALARRLYPAWGSGAQWTAWNNVAMRESGWSQYARNASSGAYGIPQALPPGKMGAAANPPQSNPTAQINWMIGYIKGRYGTPEGAWAHELSSGWYGAGGATKAGWAMVGEHGRELVKLPGGATVYPHGGTDQMVAGGSQAAALVQLEISSGGQSDFEKFMLKWLRETVRVKGGGDVQKAFGR